MAEFFFESPLWLGLVGLFFTVIAAVIWVQSAHMSALYTSAGLLALTILLVLVNVRVETEREMLEGILHDAAEAVAANDHTKLQSFIHPNAEVLVSRVAREIKRYTFTEAKITQFKEIQVTPTNTPPTAIAEFHAFVEVEGFKALRFVRVYLMQNNDRWLVKDFEHFDAAAGFRNSTDQRNF